MNGSSVGKRTLAFRSYQAAGRACSRRRHGSFEQMKEVHCSWNRGEREGYQNRSRKRRWNEAWKSFIGPRIKILVLNLKSVQRDEGSCLYKDKKAMTVTDLCFQRSLCLQFGALFCYFSTVCLFWSSELLQRIKANYSSTNLNTSEYIVTCFSHLSWIWGTYSHISCLKLFKLPWRWFVYSHTVIATNLQWQVSLGGLSLWNLLNEIYIFLSKKNANSCIYSDTYLIIAFNYMQESQSINRHLYTYNNFKL